MFIARNLSDASCVSSYRSAIKLLCVIFLLSSATIGYAQITPSKESLSDLYPGKAYSPYAQRNFPDQVFWGDTHLHTALSMDAGLFGARLGLDEAYRFARGEEVMASSGQPVRLGRPLDWLVIADHSDGMGFFSDLAAGDPDIIKFEQAKPWYEGLQAGGDASVAAALSLIATFSQGKLDPEMMTEYAPGGRTYQSIWEKVIDAAEQFNDPGNFTAFIGFEWTSLVKGNNLHRNVIFREGATKAGQVVPYTTQAPVGSTDPLDLHVEALRVHHDRLADRVVELARANKATAYVESNGAGGVIADQIGRRVPCKPLPTTRTSKQARVEALGKLRYEGKVSGQVIDKILDDNPRALYGL